MFFGSKIIYSMRDIYNIFIYKHVNYDIFYNALYRQEISQANLTVQKRLHDALA